MNNNEEEPKNNLLMELEGDPNIYMGILERRGYRNTKWGPKPTLLLNYVKTDDGQFVRDHAWIDLPHSLIKVTIGNGCVIKFKATLTRCVKGYKKKNPVLQALHPFYIDWRFDKPEIIDLDYGNA